VEGSNKSEEKAELPLEEEKIERIPEEESKEEKKEEDSSFEVIEDSAAIPYQEPTVEIDADASGLKVFDSAVEESSKPEEKAELPLEEEKKEEKDETFEPVTEADIEFKEETPEAPELKEENKIMPLEEEKENKESLDEVSYSLDEAPLDKENAGLFEYLCLVIGLGVLGFLAYLLLKG